VTAFDQPPVPPAAPKRSRRRLLAETVLSTLALACAAGALWPVLAPSVLARVADGPAGLDVVLDPDQAAMLFPREGVLALLLIGCGLVQGAGVFLRHRSRGPAVAALLALAGALGGVLAWRLGAALGPSPVDRPGRLAVGDRLEVPLRVEAWGVLLLWSVAALAVVLLLNAWVDDRPERPPRQRTTP
jgi:hypothetical protein